MGVGHALGGLAADLGYARKNGSRQPDDSTAATWVPPGSTADADADEIDELQAG